MSVMSSGCSPPPVSWHWRSYLPALVILGGGAIGCEFAYVMASFGVQVTLVEAMEHLLPTEDREVLRGTGEQLQNQGIEVLTGTRAGSLTRGTDGVSVTLTTAEGGETVREAELAPGGLRPRAQHQ